MVRLGSRKRFQDGKPHPPSLPRLAILEKMGGFEDHKATFVHSGRNLQAYQPLYFVDEIKNFAEWHLPVQSWLSSCLHFRTRLRCEPFINPLILKKVDTLVWVSSFQNHLLVISSPGPWEWIPQSCAWIMEWSLFQQHQWSPLIIQFPLLFLIKPRHQAKLAFRERICCSLTHHIIGLVCFCVQAKGGTEFEAFGRAVLFS